MSSNRSKKMIELVQVRNPAPQPATQVREHESVPSTEVEEYFEISESASISNENHLHNTTVVHDYTDDIQNLNIAMVI
ncbi:unnamed protein product [Parnassius apollo]|uniref:(apollo) hypothetical protein n=1 Tax=Parnassius apollo TaxID=110799 RepID=A0A8S3WIH1_PARAO|nr:unnamed protein product [Parnassius apollo]